jgi:hypothetical protein
MKHPNFNASFLRLFASPSSLVKYWSTEVLVSLGFRLDFSW